MGGRGASSGLGGSGSKESQQKHFKDRNILIGDSFYKDSVDSRLRSEYLEGLDEISKDFDMFKVSELSVEVGRTDHGIVGYSTTKGKLVVGEDAINGRIPYSKGNGSLSWHSAHEYAHQIQDRIIERAAIRGEYKDAHRAFSDRRNGTVTIKKILLDANAKANKIEGVKKSVYDRLQGISSYANPKNKWAHSNWREAHSEAMGKYIQGHKSGSDVFGRLVYEGTLNKYRE